MAMPKTFRMDLGIPRQDEQRKIKGRFLRVIAASSQAAAALVSIDEVWSDDAKIPLKQQAEVREMDGFNYLYFSNSAQPGEWIRVMVSDGPDDFDIRYPADVTLSGQVGIQPDQKISTDGGNNLGTGQSPVGISSSLIIAANTNRKSVTITNTSATTDMYLGVSGVTTATGALLPPVSTITLHTRAAVYGVSASGTITATAIEEQV